MGSKYNEFWFKILDVVAELIKEAYTYGRSREIDVSDLRKLGKRKSWYGVVIVSRDGIHEGIAAHVVALGKLMQRMGLLDDYGNAAFKIRVSSKLRLSIELVKRWEIKGGEIAKPVVSSSELVSYVDESIYLRIHELLELLPLHKYPVKWEDLPSNGIYFFYEDSEVLKAGNKVIKRIVRVGTHKEQGRLPDRICNHYFGNKNSSVFRRHLGAAILAKRDPNNPRLKEWMGSEVILKGVENAVSKLLREEFSFRCIRVDDADERLELERRLISTLAKFSPKYISPNWLGRYSPVDTIRRSGLWNVEHVDDYVIMESEHLNRLEQLVLETLRINNNDQNGKALILIPCCKSKSVYPLKTTYSPPISQITNLRNKLLKLIKETPDLREKPENKYGILDPNAPLTRAIDLYVGNFYKKAKKVLLDMLHGKYPHVHVLIVSAFYGLVKLGEGIKKYELTMTDKLANGLQVWQFWREEGLWKILLDYINDNNIRFVWSLLPNSKEYPYHQVFEELWDLLRESHIKCLHVEVPGAGSAPAPAPKRRARMLARRRPETPAR